MFSKTSVTSCYSIVIAVGLLTCSMVLSLTPTMVFAQTDLSDIDPAVVAFDFKLQQLLTEAEARGIPRELLDVPLEVPLEDLASSEIKRIYGALSLPKEAAKIIGLNRPGTDLPLEMFVRIQLTSADAGNRLAKSLSENLKVSKSADGTTLYKMPQQDAPPNIQLRRKSDTEFEFLTDRILASNSREFRSDILKKCWSGMPNQSLRVAIDMQSNAGLLGELAQFAGQIAPILGEYVKPLTKLESLSLAIGMKDKRLLSLAAVANSPDDAEEFQSALDSLLIIAKSQASGGRSIPGQNPTELKTIRQFVNSLQTERNGNNVSIDVSATDELFTVFVSRIKRVRMAAKFVQRQNNLRGAILACLNFESARQQFPFNYSKSGKAHADLSWRALASIYVEGPACEITKGPEDLANAKFAAQMPSLFGVAGKSAISWVVSDVKSIVDITDGASNTICLIENPAGSTSWLQRNDITQRDAIALIKSLPDGERLAVAFYDGSVRSLDNRIDEDTLRKLFDPADNEVANAP